MTSPRHHSRHWRQVGATPRLESEELLSALFRPKDLVEFRAITFSVANTSRPGRVLYRSWYTPNNLLRHHEGLMELNKSANLFYGVNPRRDANSKKDAVAVTRCVWADLDHVTHDEAARRWRPILPNPSIVVNSGRGIHAYWLLNNDHSIESNAARVEYEAALKRLYKDLGADSVQDVSRILRLPGFFNLKHVGARCTLLHCDSSLRYSLSTFDRWMKVDEPRPSPSLVHASLPSLRDAQRIRGLLRYLGRDVADRSRRDFAVAIGLLNAGLSRDEIWSLVQNHSKFETHGEPYFEVTMQNALRRLHGQ